MESFIETMPRWIKNTIISLSVFIIVLGTIVYAEMFGTPFGVPRLTLPAPSREIIINTPSSSRAAAGAGISSSTASASLAGNSPNASDASVSSGIFAAPPLSWADSGVMFSINAVTLSDNQLSFALTIQIGDSSACVPLNLRLIADESGNLQKPDTPGFALSDSGDCNGKAGEIYQNQTVTFTVSPANFPMLFTTNNDSGKYFEVVRTAGGLKIELPGTAG